MILTSHKRTYTTRPLARSPLSSIHQTRCRFISNASKNFDIEKSTDGTNYYKIGSVNAAGNSSTRKDYALRDDKLSPSNYYRLRMNDLDGHYKLSNVVLVKYDVRAQNVWVINNPFKDYIEVKFAKDAL